MIREGLYWWLATGFGFVMGWGGRSLLTRAFDALDAEDDARRVRAEQQRRQALAPRPFR